MAYLKQLLISLVVLAAAVYGWAVYVPGAQPYLSRFGVYEALGIEPAEASGGGGRGWGGGGPASVVVAPVRLGVIDDRIDAIGDGRAVRSVTLRSDVSGQIAAIPLEAGRYVEAGDPVLVLDSEAQQIELSRAQLLLDEAQDDAARLERLSGTGAVTEVRQREARLALRTAELALAQAEYELDQRTVTAPISGWVGVIDLAAGDRLSPQDVIATITDRSRIVIDFRVPERVVTQVTEGTAITARPLGLPTVALTGTVSAVDNIVDQTSRTLRVQGQVDNADDRLRSGMAFQVSLSFPGEELPEVDPLSVQWSADGSFVWAVRDGTAQRVPVVIRQRDEDGVVVEADLNPETDVVVTEGVQSLRPGSEVSIVEGSDAAGSAALQDRARL